MRHLYQCSSDQLIQNLKIWLHGATKKGILNTHMELVMFPIPRISSYCREINHTETTQTHIDRKSRAALY